MFRKRLDPSPLNPNSRAIRWSCRLLPCGSVFRGKFGTAGRASNSAHANSRIEIENSARRRSAVAARGQKEVAPCIVRGRGHLSKRHVRRGNRREINAADRPLRHSESLRSAEVGLDRAGRDTVHPNGGRELVGELPNEANNCVFARCIKRSTPGWPETGI